jgi:hypothetical protein
MGEGRLSEIMVTVGDAPGCHVVRNNTNILKDCMHQNLPHGAVMLSATARHLISARTGSSAISRSTLRLLPQLLHSVPPYAGPHALCCTSAPALPARAAPARRASTMAAKASLELEAVDIHNPESYNFVLGHCKCAAAPLHAPPLATLAPPPPAQRPDAPPPCRPSPPPQATRHAHPHARGPFPPAAHFIKTVEDLAEVMAMSGGGAKWGVAFNEASGDPANEKMPGAHANRQRRRRWRVPPTCR